MMLNNHYQILALAALNFVMVGLGAVSLGGYSSTIRDTIDLLGLSTTESTHEESSDVLRVRNASDLVNEDGLHPELLDGVTKVCSPWSINLDLWWTHNPAWVIHSESDDEFCFAKEESHDMVARNTFFRNLYDIQFGGNCSEIYPVNFKNYGLGYEMNNIVNGLRHALEVNRPVQFRKPNVYPGYLWLAALEDGSKPACPSKDMFCFFLPYGRCEARGEYTSEERKWGNDCDDFKRWGIEYATRPQQWLRRRIYEYMRDQGPTMMDGTPCAAIHVRRNDVVMEGQNSRRYYTIQEYLDRLSASNLTHRSIVLLTDDANAIDEALELHPEYDWKFVNRTRHRGKAGWASHQPSKDPVEEMVAIFAALRIVKKCDTIVRGLSSFGDMLLLSMRASRMNVTNLDVQTNPRAMRSANYTESHIDFEEKLRAKKPRPL